MDMRKVLTILEAKLVQEDIGDPNEVAERLLSALTNHFSSSEYFTGCSLLGIQT